MMEGMENFTLLLVDDNPTNLSLLAQIVELDLPQVKVFTARSAREGLNLAAEHEIDGAFVDVQMPGESGLDLCRQLKDDPRFSHIPVVLMTAHIATAELRAEGLDAGAYDFISQPISNVEMLARVKVMVRLRHSEKHLLSANEQLRRQVASKTSTLRWLSGLLLAGGDDVAEEDRELAAKLEARLPQDTQLSIEHFSGQLFKEMPLRWRRTVLKLALLDEIQIGMAERLAEIADIEGALDYLWRHNFFVDQGAKGSSYRFQNDLRERLRRQAEENLSRPDREEVHLLAADWYSQRGEVLIALDYLLAAELYSEAELLLSQQGAALVVGEALQRLAELMETVPDEVSVKRSWLALFTGISKYHQFPKEADGWLELARTHFEAAGEGHGELLALSQLVVHHLLVDGRFNLGRETLPRIQELLEEYGEGLDPISRASGYCALVIGEASFGSDLDRAEFFAREGLQHAVRSNSVELQLRLRLATAYLALLRGRFKLVFAELESCHALGFQLQLTELKRFFQSLLSCDLLLSSGDYFNCRERHQQLEHSLGRAFLQQSAMGALLCRYQIECLLAEENWDETRDQLEFCMTGGPAITNPHLRSMLLQYRALLWVGNPANKDSALADLHEATALRTEIGGLRHTLSNWVVAAICYVKLGDYGRSEELLQQALEISLSQGELLIRGGIYARQADLLLKQEDETTALEPLKQLLELMERKQHENFYLLTPNLLRRLLPVAVRNRILPGTARRLAARYLRSEIREDGSFVPLLELVTLGGSEMRREGKQVIDCSELGSVARQMMACLIVAPKQRLGIDFLLGLLWPESSASKARASFDTNLSRLRKILDSALGSGTNRDYMVMEKGVLTLQNTFIDCCDFAERVKEGEKHARRHEYWQAELAFRQADRLWQGEFLAGQDLPDDLLAERRKLTELRLDMVEAWSAVLMQDDSGAELEPLLLEGIQLDPTREQLIRRLYRYYLQKKNAVQARKILERYRQALLADDYPDDDASEIVLALEREEKQHRSGKENDESL